MRPTEFTNENIIEAGNLLTKEGKRITGFALRAQVGGGSAARLLQVWNDYLRNSAVVPAYPVAQLPAEVEQHLNAMAAELTEKLVKATVELNDRAVRTAEQRVAEVVRKAGEQAEQAEREMADATLAIEAREAELEASEAERKALEAMVSELTATLAKAREETARLSGQFEATKEQQSVILRELQRLKTESMSKVEA
ncbi:DNA-binding protein [Paraburkholderia madseniana]|uniref:DNA-binding protein n=1 Tax=Paraburkholderia madseniana TaxID=2599607 RepID=UPI0038B71AB4